MPRVHIIGAGLSGLAAAVRLIEHDVPVTVYEGAGQAGGRCRTFYDKHLEREIDNGNHLIMSGNKSALSYLKRIGAEDPLTGPPFAMYPFETWLAPRRQVAGPDALSPVETEALARLLRRAIRRLDGLFSRPMPYILTVQAAPRGFEQSFHMTIEIRPFRRDHDKLKFLAGVEQGAGVFLVDVLPEQAAARLKAVDPETGA